MLTESWSKDGSKKIYPSIFLQIFSSTESASTWCRSGPGPIEFLVELGPHYDVGYWSSMTRRNMMPIINLIKNEVVDVDSIFKFDRE